MKKRNTPDEQQRRAEAEQQALPQRRGLVERLGVDLDALGDEQLEQLVVGEGGALGLELVPVSASASSSPSVPGGG